MSSKDSWKTFQDQFQKLSDTNKSIQNNVKKLDSSKKQNDNTKLKDDLCKQLDDTTVLLKKMQEKVDQNRKELGSVEEDAKKTNKEDKKRGKMDPEESELAYQLKAQMMKNVEVQNSKLRTELTLHEKMAEVKQLNSQNRRLQDESKLSHSNMVKLLSRFEKKAKETDQKVKDLNDELVKANRLAFRYKELYDTERGRQRGKPMSPRGGEEETERERVYMPALSPHQLTSNSATLLGSSVRVNDVIRKNECLLDENETLRKEVTRLRQDNAVLIKKVKHAVADRDTMLNELETCRMSREDLVKRYQKEKTQHQLLSRTVTRQAQEFVLAKREQHQLEESARWRVVYNDRTGPINPFGSGPRSSTNAGPRYSSQSRHMMPAEDYATANQSTA